MNKMTSDSKIFHDMLFVMWKLAGYYQHSCGYTVPDKASDLQATVEETDSITKISYAFPRFEQDKPVSVSIEQMIETFNYHLYFDLLPSAGIQKYRTGDGNYDVTESFFVQSVSANNNFFTITLVYVDNPIAYALARPQPQI